MNNSVSQTPDQKLSVPTYIPLPEAARRYDLSEKMLTQLVQAGKIEAVRLLSGEVLVPANNDTHKIKTKEQIIAEKFKELIDQPITITEASRKYNIPGSTIREWIPLEYVHIINFGGYPMKLDEAEIAYCAEVYHERKASGIRSGAPLLDENGLPYELKHPELSKYRRRKRRQKNGI